MKPLLFLRSNFSIDCDLSKFRHNEKNNTAIGVLYNTHYVVEIPVIAPLSIIQKYVRTSTLIRGICKPQEINCCSDYTASHSTCICDKLFALVVG